jgi:hypothetical protein
MIVPRSTNSLPRDGEVEGLVEVTNWPVEGKTAVAIKSDNNGQLNLYTNDPCNNDNVALLAYSIRSVAVMTDLGTVHVQCHVYM